MPKEIVDIKHLLINQALNDITSVSIHCNQAHALHTDVFGHGGILHSLNEVSEALDAIFARAFERLGSEALLNIGGVDGHVDEQHAL